MPNRSFRHVVNGDPEPRNSEDCCWPHCNRKIGVIDAPLCKFHLVKVYRICQETYLWSMEPEPSEPWQPKPKSPVSERDRAPERGLVYFVRFGERIKIGFTTNLERRMTNVPHEEILATIPGTMADERRCHAAFKHLRVTGEWFRAEPDLLAFIADVVT